MPIDPVCGMDVDPADAAGTSTYKGETILLGNRRLMETNGLSVGGLEDTLRILEEQGKTAMLLAKIKSAISPPFEKGGVGGI